MSKNIRTWSASYSRLRDEVCIYNKDGKQVFCIPGDQLIHGMEYANDDRLAEIIEENYSDVLGDLGLEAE